MLPRAVWVLLLASPLLAHSVSMSTGDLRVEGSQAVYELRMPAYELTHIAEPEKALLGAVQFTGARTLSGSCVAGSDYVCTSRYAFPGPVDAVEVRSKLHEITVANHIHVLRASNGSNTDRTVLDLAYPAAELRFRPAPASEIAARAFLAGVLRAATGWTQLLFLIGMVLAARSRKELWQMSASFLAAELAAALAIPMTSWAPSPRFVEAACALTAAYLAVEILLLPKSGRRALIVAVLGLFHGMYFADLLRAAGSPVLAGAVLVEIAAIALLSTFLRGIPLRFAAGAVLIMSLAWFTIRLGG